MKDDLACCLSPHIETDAQVPENVRRVTNGRLSFVNQKFVSRSQTETEVSDPLQGFHEPEAKMVEIISLDRTPSWTPFMVRGLHSLSTLQVDEVTRTFRARGPMWAVDQHADYDGDVSVMVVHEPTGTTFTISGTKGQVDVHQLQADKLHHSGRFEYVNDAAIFLTDWSAALA